jgi:hypothetical protein
MIPVGDVEVEVRDHRLGALAAGERHAAQAQVVAGRRQRERATVGPMRPA